MSDPPRDDLAERVEELGETLEAIRDEFRRPPRGPLGLPRPPTPREAIRFADEYAIPAAIAVLEANVRLLELLRGALRAADRGREARAAGGEARERAAAVSRETLARLDGALAELQAAIEEGGLPRDGEARSLLEDARELNREVRDRLEAELDAGDERKPQGPDGDRGAPGGADGGEPAVDIEAELESIREELDGESDGEEAADPDGVNGSGSDGGEP